jgi:hypothetical protein
MVSTGHTRVLRWMAILLAMALLAAACGGGGDDEKSQSTGGGDDNEEDAGDDEGVLTGINDVLPDEDIELNEDVVVVRSDDGKAVKAFGEDGDKIVLDADAEGASDLEEGSILLLTGVTVTRVAAIEESDGELTITGEDVTLPEVIENGELEWDDLEADPDAVRLVSWDESAADAGQGEDPAADDELTDEEVEDIGDDINDQLNAPATGTDVKLASYSPGQRQVDPYTIKGKVGIENGDSVEYEFTYKVSGGKPGIALKLGFGDDLKGEVGVDVTFDGLASSGRASIAGGQVQDFEFNINDLKGDATLEASVQALANTAAAVTKPVASVSDLVGLPLGLEVPFIIGGIPFTFSAKVNFGVQLSLALAGAQLAGKAEIKFGGPGGLRYTGGQISVLGQVVTEVPDLLDTVTKVASGPVGMNYTTEFPKLGLGFGFANVASAKVFVSNGAVVAFTVLPQPRFCSAMAVSHTVAVGVEANFLIATVELGRTALTNKVFHYEVPQEPYCSAAP